jgi:ribosomal protein S14
VQVILRLEETMKRIAKDRKVRREVDKRWGVRQSRKEVGREWRRVERESKPGKGYGRLCTEISTMTGGRIGVELVNRVAGQEKKVQMEVVKKLGERGGKGSMVRNRCVETGHARSVRRWFRKSGLKVRERARQGKLEGVYRSSW